MLHLSVLVFRDSLLGSAWPVMYRELGVPISLAGIITMIIAGGTIVSSLLSDKLTRKWGAGLVTAASVFLTAVALFGFSFSSSFLLLCIWAVPYGLGAGAVDAALNNYVALHYASRHMSWLHCFWGVGAAVSPYIMSYSLTSGAGWQNGYRTVSLIQIILTVFLFASLPLWKKNKIPNTETSPREGGLPIHKVFRITGVPFVLISFFAYCALESTAMLWASSYLDQVRGIDTEAAAHSVPCFPGDHIRPSFMRFYCGQNRRYKSDSYWHLYSGGRYPSHLNSFYS